MLNEGDMLATLTNTPYSLAPSTKALYLTSSSLKMYS